MLGCAPRTVEDYARTGVFRGKVFGDGGWVFVTELLIEDVAALCIKEAEARRAKKPGLTAVPVDVNDKKQGKQSARRPPGMAHLSEEAIGKVLTAK